MVKELEEYYTGNEDIPAIMNEALGKFSAMMIMGIKSHPQFSTEFPRVYKFEYSLLGHEEYESEFLLTLSADNDDVIVTAWDNSDSMQVEIHPIRND